MPIDNSARGVRKSNERILQEGRALVITEKAADATEWSKIPVGSIRINTISGMLCGKLDPTNLLVMKDGARISPVMIDIPSSADIAAGLDRSKRYVYTILDNNEVYRDQGRSTYNDTEHREARRRFQRPATRLVGLQYVQYEESDVDTSVDPESDWVPLGIRNDGTICIAKDRLVVEETFIVEALAGNDGMFIYRNSDGRVRHMPKDPEHGYVFELEKGEYAPKRNLLEVSIDDVLRRSASSGGVSEISSNRFGILEEIYVGEEITARYTSVFRIGMPFPRIFLQSTPPGPSETGDIWLDYDGTLADRDILGENIDTTTTISWGRITGKPTTVSGYGITDRISYQGHKHTKSDITDFQHTHTKSQITDFAHTHTRSQITDFSHGHDPMVGATSSAAGRTGFVPVPAAGKQASFLRGDGAWATPPNTDTHYMAYIRAGGSGTTTNAATLNPYVTLIENGSLRSQIRLVGSGATSVQSATDGTITVSSTNTTYGAATQTANGLMSAADKRKLDNVAANANNYVLPSATASVLGGVKIGSNISVSSGTISIPNATTSALGLVKIGSNISVSGGTISVTNANVVAAIGNSYVKNEYGATGAISMNYKAVAGGNVPVAKVGGVEFPLASFDTSGHLKFPNGDKIWIA